MTQLLPVRNLSSYLKLHLGSHVKHCGCFTEWVVILACTCYIHLFALSTVWILCLGPVWHLVFFSLLSCKMASAFHCPVDCVLLSICQVDNFLPETLSLVIMARDKLCWNSWSQPPTYSTKVNLWRTRNRNGPLEENSHNSKAECSFARIFLPIRLLICASLKYVFVFTT